MRGLVLIVFFTATVAAQEPETPGPRALVDGVKVELIATAPDIVTPVGMALDKRGGLLVVESHTHQRQDDYQGPRHDRIRLLRDADGDGRPDTWSTFAEGYRHAMNLAVDPETGDIYLACRHEIRRLRDTDGDGRADHDEVIVRLETEVDYPHNGLGGIAIYPNGRLAIGLGENFGAAYRLVGSDGSELTGRGGVGIVFHCDRDGRKLWTHATGFWNPFGLCRIGDHGLVAVDNDPDASPPCRLINVLPQGDYGHRWEYGRAGSHPLQAWDGELPGTLGMMAGTGEAPCAVLFHHGWLWVTSWGEHRIERYRVVANSVVLMGGEMLQMQREVVVQGDADFRPTGMVVGPDGALYFGDWVKRNYAVHGAGRVWRLTTPATPAQQQAKERDFEMLLLSREYGSGISPAAAASLLDADGYDWTAIKPSSRFWAMRRLKFHQRAPSRELLRTALESDNADIRLYAVRWIADEHLTEYKDDVAKLLDGNIPNERYYLAVLGAIDWLSGERKPRHSGIADGLLARELRNGRRSPEAKTLALRLIAPGHKQLTTEALRGFLASDHEPLRNEAVRTLAGQSSPERFAVLSEIAADEAKEEALRADAVAGLAADAGGQRRLLEQLATSNAAAVRAEAGRVLRLAKLVEAPPEEKPPAEDIDAWLKLTNERPGDADSGRRLFHSAVGARCAACHRHSGRGGRIGPELTHVGAKLSRRRLVESILQPSREIAPRYEPWLLETDEGRLLTGLRLPKPGDDGVERYADAEGRTFEIASHRVESRRPSRESIMPSGLERLVSVQDLRDLLAFLAEPRDP